ncbi:prolactin-releasing peptide receptor-like protein [Leptotrombidium deliense]|uniref:Prolactin-releasing peptide receptor-like protein n=1 Tax=Leptotrombidium deliense TaxID=299467 RepID=A0A443S894_9ACAR|nr:prolactin-releasing peptide receptor-like protein [Leptotrombidium deliense]
MAKHILKNKSRRPKSQQVTFAMLLGNCFNDMIIKDLMVLPFSVLILLTLHWTQGSFICYTFPLLQDSCFYATSITFLLIFYNRYKIASKISFHGNLNEVCNQHFGLPAFWCLLFAWFISLIAVLPYTVYIEFIDLSHLLPIEPEGNGFCVVNLDGNIQEYIRCLFISFYIIPIALVAYFHARTTTLMKSWPGYESINIAISLPTLNRNAHRQLCARGSAEEALVESNITEYSSGNYLNANNVYNERDKQSFQLVHQPNVFTEKGAQRVLMIMFSVHSLCLFPINMLRMSKHVVIETHENSFAFDIVFVIFVAIQFSSTAIIPIVYYLWTSGSLIFGVDVHHWFYTERSSVVDNGGGSLVISNEQITGVTNPSQYNAV